MVNRLRGSVEVLREVAAVARQGWLIPRSPRRPLREHAESEHLVVFVHGYFASAGVWRPMADHLAVTGVAPRQLHFNYVPVGHVARHAERLAREVHRVHPHGPVSVVAHSLGGLIARYYVQVLGGRLDALITMGTPHHGTARAQGWPLELARELSPASPLIARLERTRDRLDHTAVTTMVAGLDVLVSRESAILDGARVVDIPWVGHHGLLYDPVAWDATVEGLMAPPSVLTAKGG